MTRQESIAEYIVECLDAADSLILQETVKGEPEVMSFALGINEYGRVAGIAAILEKYYGENI